MAKAVRVFNPTLGNLYQCPCGSQYANLLEARFCCRHQEKPAKLSFNWGNHSILMRIDTRGRPLIDSHASALKQDMQLKIQQRWDKAQGKGKGNEPTIHS